MRPLAISLLLALLLASCGYQTGSLMPAGVAGVAVEVAGNETLYRRAGILFSRELSREIIRRSKATLRDPEDAQAVIRCRVLFIPRFPIVEDRHDFIMEGGVLVAVQVEMEDLRTGQILVPPFQVSRRAEYIVPRGETLQSAIDEALHDAAVDALNRIQAHAFLAARTRVARP